MKTITKTKIPPTKTKTHHENEDTFLKQVQKRLVLPLWTKIMFMRHTTKTKVLTEIFITAYFNGRAPWSLQWDYFKAKTRFNRNDMTCISWYKMRQQDISLLMKITSTSGNYTSGEEKYTVV